MTWAKRMYYRWDASLRGLLTELDRWQARARDKNDHYSRNYSQILRMTHYLKGACLEQQKGLLALAGKPQVILDKSSDFNGRLTALYRLWAYFRDHLIARDVADFRPYLRTADDLAWSYYNAARQAAQKADPQATAHIPDQKIKEPPLVYFNGDFSPLAQERGRRFMAQALADNDLNDQVFGKMLDALPVPMIGIPWRQVAHLPDALVIAHETGHLVEDDFGLRPLLDTFIQEALKNRPEDSRNAWKEWRREVFADIYGTLAAGPAYLQTLAGFLARKIEDIAGQRRRHGIWFPYPTISMRVYLCAETLRQMLFETEAQELEQAWDETYNSQDLVYAGARKQRTALKQDLPRLVDAILKGPYPSLGGALTDVICFTPAQQQQVLVDKNELLKGKPPAARDACPLAVAAQLAFAEDPAAYQKARIKGKTVNDYLLDLIPSTADNRSPAINTRPMETLLKEDEREGAAFDRFF